MEQKKPNLLLIMTDQQRWDTIRAAGNPYIETPNLDRLCRTGVRFERAYCESPECVPARAMVLTGKWGHKTGCLMNTTPLAEDERTFPEILKDNGYYTQAIGKMHFHPARAPMGFDRLFLSEEIPLSVEEDEYMQFLRNEHFDHVHEPHGLRHEYYYMPQVSQLPDRLHNTTWVGNQTVDFIHNQFARERPWFLFTSFIKPHPPFDATVPYITRFDHERMPLPVRSRQEKESMWALHRWQNVSKWMEEPNEYLERLIKANYYACITQIDAQIGRILDALEQAGLRENTLIMFVSDHGEMLGDHYQWGKRSYYNGAARIPFIVSMPGRVEQGAVRQDLVGHLDIAASMLAMAGLDSREYGLDGINLLAEESGLREEENRDIGFGEFGTDDRMLFMAWDGEWKYIYAPNGRREALFCLSTDPDELNNVADVPVHGAEKSRLHRALLEFLREGGHHAALTENGADLAGYDEREIPVWRNRQYAQWVPVVPPCEAKDIYRPE